MSSHKDKSFGGLALQTSLVIISFRQLSPSLSSPRHRADIEARRNELNRLLTDEWEYTLRTQPELATQVGDNRYNDRLSDFSDKAIAGRSRTHSSGTEALRVLVKSPVSGPEKLKSRTDAPSLHEALDRRNSKTGDAGDPVGAIHLGLASAALRFPFRPT